MTEYSNSESKDALLFLTATAVSLRLARTRQKKERRTSESTSPLCLHGLHPVDLFHTCSDWSKACFSPSEIGRAANSATYVPPAAHACGHTRKPNHSSKQRGGGKLVCQCAGVYVLNWLQPVASSSLALRPSHLHAHPSRFDSNHVVCWFQFTWL